MKKKFDTIAFLFGLILILSGCSTTEIPTPTVSTIDVTSITEMTAVAGGIISSDNGSIISNPGVCWSTSPNPTIEDNKLNYTGDSPNSFTCNLTGLSPITTYYVRAFATNILGTVYGNEQIFTTLAGVPKACFECVSNIGYKVTFTNCSEYPTSCLWDFGDGTSSIENAPTHVYNSIGTYTIKLTVSNEGLSDFVTKTVVVSDIINLENTPIEWYNGLLGTYIDVDSDGKKDFFVYGYSHTGPSQSTSEKSILPFSNYGIVCDSINVDVWDSYYNPANFSKKYYTPKKFMLGNTIFNSEKTNTNNIRFSFSSNSYYSRTSYNSWDKDEVRYIGYINKIGNDTKIGWIKLNLFGSISLYSFKMPIEGTSLLIDN